MTCHSPSITTWQPYFTSDRLGLATRKGINSDFRHSSFTFLTPLTFKCKTSLFIYSRERAELGPMLGLGYLDDFFSQNIVPSPPKGATLFLRQYQITASVLNSRGWDNTLQQQVLHPVLNICGTGTGYHNRKEYFFTAHSINPAFKWCLMALSFAFCSRCTSSGVFYIRFFIPTGGENGHFFSMFLALNNRYLSCTGLCRDSVISWWCSLQCDNNF